MPPSLTQELNENFYRMAPWQFMYDRQGPRSQMISDTLKKFYLNNEPISDTTQSKLAEVSMLLYENMKSTIIFFSY